VTYSSTAKTETGRNPHNIHVKIQFTRNQHILTSLKKILLNQTIPRMPKEFNDHGQPNCAWWKLPNQLCASKEYDLAPDLLNIDEPITEQELRSRTESEKHIGLENTYEPTCDIKEVDMPFSTCNDNLNIFVTVNKLSCAPIKEHKNYLKIKIFLH